jgi:hypothetical protein
MDYIITIPSYKRAKICKEKTIALLERENIDKKKIYIFVVPEEYDEYNSLLGDYKIVKGVKGLINQRIFITEYFKEGKKIVMMDDDLKDVIYNLSKYKSLQEFIVSAFHDCTIYKNYLWGVYPLANEFYMKGKDMTFGLVYCIGAFFGIINRKIDKNLLDKENELKEDVERSLKYFINDGILIRYNKVGISTKYYGNDGGGLGKFGDRIEGAMKATELLCEQYKDYCTMKIRPNRMPEVVFKKIENENTIIKQLDKYPKNIFEDLENMLNEIVIPTRNNRKGFGIHHVMTFGLAYGRITRRVQPSVHTIQYPEIAEELERIGKIICKDIHFTSVHLLKNTVSPRHRDGKNSGFSVLCSFGDYEGNNIVVNGKEYDASERPVYFNGRWLEHYNTPLISGNKYSLVFYNREEVL